MNVALVVAAYNQPEWLKRLVDTAQGTRHELEIHLHLHSDDPATANACEDLAARPYVQYHPHGHNRGLSRTWNDGMLAAYDEGAAVVVIANDDIAFAPGDLDRLAGLHEENCGDTHVEHGGSSAIFTDPALAAANGPTQARNMAYYRRKWGGDGDHERFEHPFDNPAFGLRIAPDHRAHPYGPDFDRTPVSA